MKICKDGLCHVENVAKCWYFNLAFMFKRENGKYHFKGIVSKRLVKELEND